ncbi:anhydro-N-acetylmuramic acid kinase [Pollutibacter soli]|uniref:anhydro-N-acetylmuramic acid kinase n=1 Tax=Pollutibacter soli TaxID=3034157 RepID=UPI003013C438
MLYRVIGMMSGSSLDGMDLVFAELQETGGKWTYEIKKSSCYPYSPEWKERLSNAIHLDAMNYVLLHADYGHYIGKQINAFISEHQIDYQVGLIASHGHTTFHQPPRMTGQLGEGAAIAAETGLPVVCDLRALDLAFGGQGAPIVPLGEKMLLGQYAFFLNLGGIANISCRTSESYIAFDICPANRVLNLLIAETGQEYDAEGRMASAGNVSQELLEKLNDYAYYRKAYPKSLANTFGTDEIFPLIKSFDLNLNDALRTYVEHIAIQIKNSVKQIAYEIPENQHIEMLVTGGGVFNNFLLERIAETLAPIGINVKVAEPELAMYKEALIMAFLGVLRWREEVTVLPSVTGARKASIGGALWMGYNED